MDGATDRQASSPPDWNLVQFDVGCARCGHDLRGLSESTCPDCGLEFDWSDAVPLEELTCLHCGYHLYGLNETRCPECGKPFVWEEVVADFHRHKKPLFEYRWRKEPVRSLVRTWIWALWPRKLWSKMDIHDPPQIGPLLMMVLVALLAFGSLIALLEGLYDWLLLRSLAIQYARPIPGTADLPSYLSRALSGAYLRDIILSTLIWLCASLVALMIFRQSMRRCKVRTVHVVRAWAYATPLMLPVVVAIGYIPFVVSAMLNPYYQPWTDTPLTLVFLCHVMYSLYQGYSSYLRMRHSAAVAIVSQFVAVLATVTVWASILRPAGLGGSFMIELLQYIGVW